MIITSAFLLFLNTSIASDYRSCSFMVEVKFVDMDIAVVTLSAPRATESTECRRFLGEKRVSLKKVKKGRALIQKKAKLRVLLEIYSGLGPKGPVSERSWKFSQLKKES